MGRYDRGPEATARWFSEVEVARAWLAGWQVSGASLIELAPGTGLWSEQLVKLPISSLHAVDGSSAMLSVLSRRVGEDPRVTSELADLFTYEPTRRYDGAFAGFFLSHVPRERMVPFLERVAQWLEPGAALRVVDSLRIAASTADDHVLPEVGDEVMTRRLNDGREFEIVKNFYPPAELVELSRQAGLRGAAATTGEYFVLGEFVK